MTRESISRWPGHQITFLVVGTAFIFFIRTQFKTAPIIHEWKLMIFTEQLQLINTQRTTGKDLTLNHGIALQKHVEMIRQRLMGHYPERPKILEAQMIL